MKLLLISTIVIFSFICSHATELIYKRPADSLEIKKWAKEDFINAFGFNDTAKAVINLFLQKIKKEKIR